MVVRSPRRDLSLSPTFCWLVPFECLRFVAHPHNDLIICLLPVSRPLFIFGMYPYRRRVVDPLIHTSFDVILRAQSLSLFDLARCSFVLLECAWNIDARSLMRVSECVAKLILFGDRMCPRFLSSTRFLLFADCFLPEIAPTAPCFVWSSPTCVHHVFL